METQLALFERAENTRVQLKNEYFFLISPDENTRAGIKALKELLHEKISISPENLWAVPHVSLFKYQLTDNYDEPMGLLSQKVLGNFKPFRVSLQGTEIQSDGNTTKSLVIKVKNPEPVISLYRSLVGGFQLGARELRPNITIARSVPSNKMSRVHSYLNEFNFKGEFICNKVTILKKVIEGEDNKRYKKLHEIMLG